TLFSQGGPRGKPGSAWDDAIKLDCDASTLSPARVDRPASVETRRQNNTATAGERGAPSGSRYRVGREAVITACGRRRPRGREASSGGSRWPARGWGPSWRSPA